MTGLLLGPRKIQNLKDRSPHPCIPIVIMEVGMRFLFRLVDENSGEALDGFLSRSVGVLVSQGCISQRRKISPNHIKN